MQPTVKTAKLVVGSSAFDNNDFVPVKFTCDGENTNPEITVSEIPSGTKSLAIIVDDPDAPNGTFVHWLMWNISPAESIKENSAPGVQGKNSFGHVAYSGPCPPAREAHRYFFKVYALDRMLDIAVGADKTTMEKAMQDHILAQGEIIGMYKRTS